MLLLLLLTFSWETEWLGQYPTLGGDGRGCSRLWGSFPFPFFSLPLFLCYVYIKTYITVLIHSHLKMAENHTISEYFEGQKNAVQEMHVALWPQISHPGYNLIKKNRCVSTQCNKYISLSLTMLEWRWLTPRNGGNNFQTYLKFYSNTAEITSNVSASAEKEASGKF